MTNVPLSHCAERGTLYIFVVGKILIMGNFVAAILIMMSLSMATFQLVRNAKYRELSERRQRIMSIVLYGNAGLLLLDLAVGGPGMETRFLVDVMLAVIAVSTLASSLWTTSKARPVVWGIIVLQTLLSMYYMLCLFSLSVLSDIMFFRYAVIALTLIYAALFLCGIWMRLREVRLVMHSGTVWIALTLAVDAFYVVVVITELMVAVHADPADPFVLGLMTILVAGALIGYGIRIACDTVFVLMLRHERRIVESMKISPVEVAGIGQREDDIYKDIYDRVLEYFEKDKPFLNGNLTINDIVGVVFTNKLYISRAISQYTGRNFCQFVNYHRIMYSVACFRENSELKVAELWPMSGFNSIVSYNMAFRLFMGENPSDWCRKEKVRLSRKEK